MGRTPGTTEASAVAKSARRSRLAGRGDTRYRPADAQGDWPPHARAPTTCAPPGDPPPQARRRARRARDRCARDATDDGLRGRAVDADRTDAWAGTGQPAAAVRPPEPAGDRARGRAADPAPGRAVPADQDRLPRKRRRSRRAAADRVAGEPRHPDAAGPPRLRRR